MAALLLASAAPAEAQWRYGLAADPAASLHSRAGNLAGYAQMVDTWGDRLSRAVRDFEALPPAERQEGVLSQPRMHLLDVLQTAWLVIKNVPADFNDSAAYQAVEVQFSDAIIAVRDTSTPTPEALAEARTVIAALERLEAAALNAALHAER